LQQQQHRLETADGLLAPALRTASEARDIDKRGKLQSPGLEIALDDRVELRVQALDRRAGAQPSDAVRNILAAIPVRRLVGRERERHPRVDVRVRERERLRHHANDAESLAVQPEVAADDIRAGAEPRAPEPIAQDDDAFAAGRRLLVREAPAGQRLNAENAEERRRRARQQ